MSKYKIGDQVRITTGGHWFNKVGKVVGVFWDVEPLLQEMLITKLRLEWDL